MELSSLKDNFFDRLAQKEALKQGLNIKFFDCWRPEFEDVLKVLPEEEICPHELFALLCRNPASAAKRIVLIEEQGEPIALACLRREGYHWVPVTHYIVPGFLFPAKDGYIEKAIAAIGLDVRIAWWRWEKPPPKNPFIRDVISAPTHGMLCSEDFEVYWRSVGHFKNIRKYRNRCQDFDLKVNVPGMTEWTIKNWELRWRSPEQHELPGTEDRLLVAEYLEKRGQFYSLCLFDHDKPAASATIIIHRKDAVAYVNYRDNHYDWNGAMSRLIELIFHWSKDMGFENIDIGGSFDYKDRWAPEHGTKWEFRVCPDFILKFSRAKNIVRAGWSAIIGQQVKPHPDKSCASDIRGS